MRTLCQTVGDRTSFIIADLAPAYHAAARELYYAPTPAGFAKTYPADLPHLARIYRQFARHAEEMILQMAQVRAAPWDEALRVFLQVVAPEHLDWWLVGSAALAVRGMDVAPRDVDLVVDGVGAQRLGELLLDHLIEPVVPTPGWIAHWFGRAFLGARLEWVGEIRTDLDDQQLTDFGPEAARRSEVVQWGGQAIRVPPLDLQLQISERRGLTERVAKIRQFMQASR